MWTCQPAETPGRSPVRVPFTWIPVGVSATVKRPTTTDSPLYEPYDGYARTMATCALLGIIRPQPIRGLPAVASAWCTTTEHIQHSARRTPLSTHHTLQDRKPLRHAQIKSSGLHTHLCAP